MTRVLKITALIGMICSSSQAESLREQTIDIHEGWNAVFLEVYPTNSDPAVVFADTPIDMAATHYAPVSSAQFIADPSADLFKGSGWGVWYAKDRREAFLTTLHGIYGQQAYLVHAKHAYQWRVKGLVVSAEVLWKPDSYNFIGFSVHAQAPPTFAQFFSGSNALDHDLIYRLLDGTWRRVLNPDAESMRSGEAFWIYCEGASTYQGPLSVQTKTRYGLVLGSEPDGVILRNHTDHPVVPTVDHVASSSQSVPISIVIKAIADSMPPIRSISTPMPDSSWTLDLPPLEARSSIKVPLESRIEEMDELVRSSLLKISSDMGTETWIPVVGIREDLEEQ